MAHTSLAILESKPEVGSSRKTTIGCEMSAKATLTRLASALRPKRSRKPFPQWVLQGSQSSQPCGCQGTCPPEMPRLNTLPITLSDCNYDSCRTSHVPVMTCNECFFWDSDWQDTSRNVCPIVVLINLTVHQVTVFWHLFKRSCWITCIIHILISHDLSGTPLNLQLSVGMP